MRAEDTWRDTWCYSPDSDGYVVYMLCWCVLCWGFVVFIVCFCGCIGQCLCSKETDAKLSGGDGMLDLQISLKWFREKSSCYPCN